MRDTSVTPAPALEPSTQRPTCRKPLRRLLGTGSSHGVGLNYGNILDQRRTIEYRYFDSSLDPARLQANIKLACMITKRASTLPDSAIPTERVQLGSHADGQVDDSASASTRSASAGAWNFDREPLATTRSLSMITTASRTT